MDLNSLTAVSPIDGRYADQSKPLRPYFSEFALIKYRVIVEIRWFQKQMELFSIDVSEQNGYLEKIIEEFSIEDAEKVKAIEKTTQHDVKAVEYFLKEKFDVDHLKEKREYIHFTCTSEDINNLAYGLMLKDALTNVIFPKINSLLSSLDSLAKSHSSIPMMSRTHGQSATPTTIGKEIANFVF